MYSQMNNIKKKEQEKEGKKDNGYTYMPKGAHEIIVIIRYDMI